MKNRTMKTIRRIERDIAQLGICPLELDAARFEADIATLMKSEALTQFLGPKNKRFRKALKNPAPLMIWGPKGLGKTVKQGETK
jgi:hypothetical protein